MNNSSACGRSSGQVAQHRRRVSRVSRGGRLVGLPCGLLEAVALVLIALFLILGVLSTSRARTVPPSLSQIKVQAGDSLWTLAVSHPVNGFTTAELVDLLVKANQLDGVALAAGDTILVPADSLGQMLAAR